MSAAGSGSAVSRKCPLSLEPASCGSGGGEAAGGGGGGSGSPRAKRRLFADGGAVPPARPDSRTTVAAAEVDRIKLHRRRLIVHGAALAAAAAVCCLVVLRRRGRKYSVQQLAHLCEALRELASAIRATASVEPHPDLYPTVMAIPGFAEEQLIIALMYLVEGQGRGTAFLVMSDPDRALWMEQILAKQ